MSAETTAETDKRRLARLKVSPDLFLDLCKESEWPRVTQATKNAIPKGTQLVGVNYDNIAGCFDMGIRHYSFKVVPINEEPPLLEPVEVTSSIGAYMRMVDEISALRAQAAQLAEALRSCDCDSTTPSFLNCDALYLKNIQPGQDAPFSDEMCAEMMQGETPCARCTALAAYETGRTEAT